MNEWALTLILAAWIFPAVAIATVAARKARHAPEPQPLEPAARRWGFTAEEWLNFTPAQRAAYRSAIAYAKPNR